MTHPVAAFEAAAVEAAALETDTVHRHEGAP